MVLERRALTTDSCVFSNGERVFGWLPPLRPSEPRYSLLPAVHSRAAASSPPSGAAMPPPPRLPESRCRLLPAYQSRAAASSPPTRVALPACRLQLPALHSRAAASSPPSRVALPPSTPSRAALPPPAPLGPRPPFRAARAAASFTHSRPRSPERTPPPLLCHVRCTMLFSSLSVCFSTQCQQTGW